MRNPPVAARSPEAIPGEPSMRPVFVLIKCEMGKAYEVAGDAVDLIEQTSEVYSISGQYDLLGKFYVENDADIGRFVTERVQTLPGVKDTFTIITFNAFTADKPPAGS
jgi:DNA-binding Lrp family transcriptional regulator